MAFDLMDVFVKIGADTSDLEGGINKAKSLASGLGEGFGGAVSKGVKLVGSAIAAGTAAVGAFAAASVKVGSDFDSSMSQVAATMGVTTDEIGELRDFAMQMGSSTAFSATQAADALNYMALAGYDADQSMEMLPTVLNLAAAGNMDLARASDMVTDAQTALGLSFDETTQMVDMMAKTSSKSNTSVEQLGDAILTVGGTAKTLAGGTNELNTALGILADNSIKGSEGGTKLRNIILSLSSPTDKAAELLEGLGITTQDAAGNLLPLNDIMGQLGDSLDGLGSAERSAIISEIFNKTDIAAVNALLDTSAERWDELSTEIDGAWMSEKSFQDALKGTGLENAQKKLAKLNITQEDFEKAAKLSKGSAYEFAQTLAEMAGTDINVILDEMDTNLSDLQRTFDSVTGSAEQMAQTQLDNLAGDVTMFKSALEGAQLLISGALTPDLRKFVQFGTEGLQKVSEGFKEGGLSGAMDAFKGVLSDGIKMITESLPGWVDAGIELLGALGQGIVDNIPTLLTALEEIGASLAETLLELMQSAAEGLEEFDWAEMAQNIVDWITTALTSDTAGGILQAGIDIVTNLASGFLDAAPVLLDAMSQGMDNITQAINDFDFASAAQSIVDGIKGYLTSDSMSGFLDSGLALAEALVNAILEAAPTFADGAIEIIGLLAEGLADATTGLLDSAIQIITDLTTYLSDNVGSIVDVGASILSALIDGITGAIPTLIQNLPTIIDNIVSTFETLIPKLAETGVKLIGQLILGIGEAVPSLIENFPAIIDEIVNIWETFNWLNIGMLIIQGIVQGISDLAQDAPDKMQEIADNCIEAIKNSDWFQAGSRTIELIVDGIMAIADDVKTQVQDIIDKAIDLWNSTDWLSLGTNLVEGIWSGISGGYDWITQRISEWAGSVFDWFKSVFKIESPSKLMRDQVGKFIGLGVAEGITDTIPEVEDSLGDITDLVENPDIPDIHFADIGDADKINSMFESDTTVENEEKYDNLAEAIVKAFLKANIAVECDDREFGRLVRKIGATT